MRVVFDRGNPDILIPSEGTYPYVRGGVSSWIAQLMAGMPQYTFGIVFIGSKESEYDSNSLYEFPENLIYFVETYLFDEGEKVPIKATKSDEKSFENIKKLHHWFKYKGKDGLFPDDVMNLDFYLHQIDESVFLYSRESWEFILEENQKSKSNIPFIDYFWAIRNIHLPIWKVVKLAKLIREKGKLIHAPSTGYAGFLATLISNDRDLPFILTEHGIYTKERKIDILSNSSMGYQKLKLFQESAEHNVIQEMWVKFFEGIGFMSYNSADVIFSLFNVAREAQIAYGAEEKKCQVIPNGVDVERLSSVLNERDEEIPQVITLIGRVVSIKDIKTFIRAIKITADEIPTVEAWIVGPENEDEAYVQECRELISILDLNENIKFLGFQNILDILPKSGLLTLTSISEGMPLVILEGFAAGLPCVSTDVGSCKELIYGSAEEDRALGPAGRICQIANPKELAESYIELLSDKDKWNQAQKSALKRVNKYYTQEIFLSRYQKIYSEMLEEQSVEEIGV